MWKGRDMLQIGGRKRIEKNNKNGTLKKREGGGIPSVKGV